MSQNPSPAQPAKKKGGCLKYLAIATAVVVLLIILAAACGGGGDPAGTDDPDTTTQTQDGTTPAETQETEEAATGRVLVMEATSTSTGQSTVTWHDLDGSMNSEHFTGTWTKEIEITDTAARYYMTVSPDIMDTTTATVTCSMSLDGEEIDSAEASGDSLVAASCDQPLFG